MDWAGLFPERDHEFALRMRRGNGHKFFGASEQSDLLLNERRRWLERFPERHFLFEEGAGPVIAEAVELLAGWNLSPPIDKQGGENAARAQLLGMGLSLEPDILLLRHSDKRFRLVAGCVCFPSSWSPRAKVGLTLRAIHEAVPGLNEAIGPAIDQFVFRMAPGIAWLRSNWGLCRTLELNQDPGRELPKLSPEVAFASVVLRVERQALVRLPRADGLMFGIRVEMMCLENVVADPVARRGLRRALESMPEALAAYKGVDSIRRELCDWLDGLP